MTYKTYCKAYPIGRSFHTGRYGYARVLDSLDLSQCIYPTPQTAGKARKRAYVEHQKDDGK